MLVKVSCDGIIIDYAEYYQGVDQCGGRRRGRGVHTILFNLAEKIKENKKLFKLSYKT